MVACRCQVSALLHVNVTYRHNNTANTHVTAGWSDIYGLSEKDKEDRAGFDESAARVNAIIQREIDGGIKPARIIVAGFSQGGAVAFHTALRSTHALGGCVALSTWVPLRADYPAALSEAAKGLKILQVRIYQPWHKLWQTTYYIHIQIFYIRCDDVTGCAMWSLYAMYCHRLHL